MIDHDAALLRLDGLAEASRARDPQALTEVYELTADLLLSIVLGIVRDRETAYDVVQDAFGRYVEHCAEIRGSGRSIRAWLIRTARNRALDVLRSADHRRTDATAELPELPGVDETVAAVLDTEPTPEFALAFAALTPDQRMVLTLRHVHGMSGEEVGRIMERSRAAVYVLAQRAERRMRDVLGERSIPGG